MSGKSKITSFCAIALGALLALAAAGSADARGKGKHGGDSRPGRFDYYVVSLSWSPSYCAVHPDEAQQCGKGYGFVLHGLWPQYRGGGWPQNCSTSKTPDDDTVTHMLAIMPSRHLIEHEWETHGACSGLGPKDYFATAEDAFSRVTIPQALKTPATSPSLSADELTQAFMDVNPGLEDNMISVQCKDGGTLEEVRICVDKDNLSVKSCGGRVRNSCRVGKLTIPAVR
jgi:ribonuclease T2